MGIERKVRMRKKEKIFTKTKAEIEKKLLRKSKSWKCARKKRKIVK